MRHKLIGLLEQSPVIPAVKDETALTRAAGCESRVLFLLGGDLLTIPGWIARTHEAGKQAVVHGKDAAEECQIRQEPFLTF